MNNFFKLIIGGIATIILGAIGSGVWEKLLSPLLSSIGGSISSFLSSVSTSYSDSLYSRAANILMRRNIRIPSHKDIL